MSLSIGFSPQLSADSLPYLIGSVYFLLLFIGLLVDLVLMGRFLTLPLPWDKMTSKARERPWFAKDVFRLALILVLIQLTAGFSYWLGVKLGWFPQNEKEAAAALVQGLLFHGAALFMIWFLMHARNSSLDLAFGMNWRSLRQAAGQGLISYAGILPVVFMISVMYQLFLYAAGYPVTEDSGVDPHMES